MRIPTLVLLSSVLVGTSLFAVKTEQWELKSPQDFMTGKLQRLVVTSDGQLRLGYDATKLGEFAKDIWCSVVDRDGTIYFGTGSPADVYALRQGWPDDEAAGGGFDCRDRAHAGFTRQSVRGDDARRQNLQNLHKQQG